MKSFITHLFALFSFVVLSQNTNHNISFYSSEAIINYYLDVDGTLLDKDKYYEKYRDKTIWLNSWHYTQKDSGYVAKLHDKKFEYYELNQKEFIKNIEELTNKRFTDSTLFLIQYVFKDDYCSSISTNNYNKAAINFKKKFTNKNKELIKKENKDIEYFVFFEEGIKLKKSSSSNEYYFSDKNNVLKNSFFKNKTLCGSFIITNSDQKALVRNGEFIPIEMLGFLKPEIWSKIFYDEN